jgi:hypothetical protein
LLLGFWMFMSAFLWRHAPAPRTIAWVVGMAVVLSATAGLAGSRWGRYLNAVAGGCLIVSSLLPTVHGATFWNQIVVGFLITLFGVSPSLSNLRHRRPVTP